MLKKLDLDKFYTEENKKIDKGNGLGGVGLLTPNQFINVFNYEKRDNEGNYILGLGSHVGTYMTLLNEIYSLNISNNQKNYPDIYKLTTLIPNGEKNFVHIQYVVSAIDFVTINLPMYITEYQYNKLEEFNEILKGYDIVLEAIILNYNPIKGEYVNINQDNPYFSQENALIDALKYMKENNRVINYELPFGEEKKLNLNSKKL